MPLLGDRPRAQRIQEGPARLGHRSTGGSDIAIGTADQCLWRLADGRPFCPQTVYSFCSLFVIQQSPVLLPSGHTGEPVLLVSWRCALAKPVSGRALFLHCIGFLRVNLSVLVCAAGPVLSTFSKLCPGLCVLLRSVCRRGRPSYALSQPCPLLGHAVFPFSTAVQWVFLWLCDSDAALQV